jgi:hypothetical protein
VSTINFVKKKKKQARMAAPRPPLTDSPKVWALHGGGKGSHFWNPKEGDQDWGMGYGWGKGVGWPLMDLTKRAYVRG